MKQHKPGCMANIQCMVYHSDGVCPGPYGKCTCEVGGARPTAMTEDLMVRVGMLRQWLNEDRITDPHKLITNEDIIKMLQIEPSTADARRDTTDLEEWIDAGIDSFISVGREGEEYLNEEDIANAKAHLSKIYRSLHGQSMKEDWRKEFDEKFVFREEETADEGRGFVIGEGLREDIGPNEIKDFVEDLLTTRTEQAVAEERERVREVVESERWSSHEMGYDTRKEIPVEEANELCMKSHNGLVDTLLTALQDPGRGGEKQSAPH